MNILYKLNCITLSNKTKKSGRNAIISLTPALPWFIFIPIFCKDLIRDLKGQWTAIRMADENKTKKRIKQFYNLEI